MSKHFRPVLVVRHILAVLVALPLIVGVLSASFAAPCPHEHGGSTDQSRCPCCDKAMLAASVPCLSCQTAVEAGTDDWQPQLDARRILFARLLQAAHGLDVKPPLPPPRLLSAA